METFLVSLKHIKAISFPFFSLSSYWTVHPAWTSHSLTPSFSRFHELRVGNHSGSLLKVPEKALRNGGPSGRLQKVIWNISSLHQGQDLIFCNSQDM
jgi:hypothetical protein